MWGSAALLAATLLIAGIIVLPAMGAWHRRRASCEASFVAAGLAEYASSVREEHRRLPLDDALLSRAQRLRVPELVSFVLAQELGAPPELLADAAQRLALRLKRRAAFERKMLARTAPGRRRGALAAAIPPLSLALFAMSGLALPVAALLLLLILEALGCWLLWRVARVEI
jgi:hypothetical protein